MCNLRQQPILLLLLPFFTFGLSSASLFQKVTKNIPFLSKKKEYTPLVFFTVPKDNIPECDEMEKVVTKIENELDVRVERMDILRDPNAGVTLSLLTTRRPPFLYHRESLQTVSVPSPSSMDNKKNAEAIIDEDRVRAWAKGRYLPAQSMVIKAKKGGPGGTALLSQEDSDAIDQADIIEDMTLTPTQKSGKDAMKKRTEELAK